MDVIAYVQTFDDLRVDAFQIARGHNAFRLEAHVDQYLILGDAGDGALDNLTTLNRRHELVGVIPTAGGHLPLKRSQEKLFVTHAILIRRVVILNRLVLFEFCLLVDRFLVGRIVGLVYRHVFVRGLQFVDERVLLSRQAIPVQLVTHYFCYSVALSGLRFRLGHIDLLHNLIRLAEGIVIPIHHACGLLL